MKATPFSRALLWGVLALFPAWPAPAVLVLYKTANVAVHEGIYYGHLEFENPLTGTEYVLSHKVLEWRDAEYDAGPPPWFDDWTVNDPLNVVGDVNEIWMVQAGQSAETLTTLPGKILSVHLAGDSNDGVAEVAVDDVLVAVLDMNSAVPTTVTILVKNLPNVAHVIRVADLGAGGGGQEADDVALMGAAVLEESQVKWDQPPDPGNPTNVFYGWNEHSVYETQICADDWVCTSSNPVTDVRWWGSFSNWTQRTPPVLPDQFQIAFWTDIPAGSGSEPFSHPGTVVHVVSGTGYTWQFAGWDYDPKSQQYEACFVFDLRVKPEEWFYQDPGYTGTNIYWVSISAMYLQGVPQNPWGWKTRPRDPASLAPDDAVVINNPSAPYVGAVWIDGYPIYWPTPADSWDLAFELASVYTNETAKFTQPPELSSLGIDVQDSAGTGGDLPDLLADDFLCTVSGAVTRVTLWASWLYDQWPSEGPGGVPITLSFHSDIPDYQSPSGYSMPGPLLWLYTFQPGSYWVQFEAAPLNENWYDVFGPYLPGADQVCWRYDFDIPLAAAFVQTGSVENPVVYWLDAQANVSGSDYRFGWKTSSANWNDAAVWFPAIEPYEGNWAKITYPQEHPYYTNNLDLAFSIVLQQEVRETKWSQPPEPYGPPDAINGWDQRSVYGETIVADDWACTNYRPVTDIHWWGSHIGWGGLSPPQMPDAFALGIWTDVPAEQGGGFSHPGVMMYQVYCTNFTWRFAGWDFDPRDPTAAPETCFYYEQELMTNEWFWQDPRGATSIYWLSVAAVYSETPQQYAWGWKTRPRAPGSSAPDDAVVILSPPRPEPGMLFEAGEPIEYPPGVSWDTAFTLTTREPPPEIDFGDAPDGPYPTVLLSNGARHTIVPGVFLGQSVDAETDGQPDATATGDDNNNDDEDGVTFTSLLVPGRQASVDVVASTNGLLQAWVDFDANGSWSDAGDWIFASQPVTTGVNSLTFPVPPGASAGASTFARFRFSTAGPLSYDGLANDGEVEDYPVRIADWGEPNADLGDAPDSSNSWGVPMSAYPAGGFPPAGVPADYPTVYQGGAVPPFGPYHAWTPAAGLVFLGPNVSLEVEADIGPDQDPGNNIQPVVNTPDQDLLDDGVGFPLTLPHCSPANVQLFVTVAVPPMQPMLWVNVWFDWNRDGDWNDVLACPDGGQAWEWAVPNQFFLIPGPGVWPVLSLPFTCWQPSTNVQPIWMRVTLSEQMWPAPGGGVAGGDGPAAGYLMGETEDYYVTAYVAGDAFDFGDAPDPSYPTLMASDGARHGVVPGFLMGAQEDSEADGLQDPNAVGDDNNNLDDEDGVALVTALILNTQACADVTVQAGPAGGLLDAWVDFDGNGAWQPAEKVFSSLVVTSGVNTNLCFSVPQGAKLGTTFARFRLSSGGGLPPSGGAQDGEVEDYQFTILQSGPSGTLVITNIVRLTNGLSVIWGTEPDVHYQLQATTNLIELPAPAWWNIGNEVISPTDRQLDTNAVEPWKMYRVIAPYTP